MSDRHTDIASLLIDIEAALRQHGLWEAEPPTDEQLASTQPFCIDTLAFPQWLQFVMIPRFYAIIEVRGELPANCSISPVAEVYFDALGQDVRALMAALERLDALFG
ncbi:MAG: YqcC family protein [Gammaproteobacteria bacterium]|nr:MAG: YqcC family protein [Gammaproteobacteria bacterium]